MQLFAVISGRPPVSEGDTPHLLNSAMSAVRSAQSDDASVASERDLKRLVTALEQLLSKSSGGSALSHLASGYISWACVFWHLFLPNIPIDPAVASQAKTATVQRKKARLLVSSAIHAYHSQREGDKGSIQLDVLINQLARLDNALTQLEGLGVSRPSNTALVTALFAELQSAGNSIFSNVSSLPLNDTATSGDANIVSRLQNLRHTLQALVLRLQRIYLDYADILKPITMCFAALSIGLELWVTSIQRAEAGPMLRSHEDALQNVVAFPTIRSAQAITTQGLPTTARIEQASIITHVQAVRMRLTSLSHLAGLGKASSVHLTSAQRKAVKKSYDQIFGLWSADRATEAAEKAEAESIYKSRRTEVLIPDDDELEAKDMARLFQTEELASDDIKPNNGHSGRRHLAPDDVIAAFGLHTSIFGKKKAETKVRRLTQQQGMMLRCKRQSTLRSDIIRDVIKAFPSQLSANIDDASICYRISELHASIQHNTVTKDGLDFYADSQPSQLRKMQVPILAMQKRARQLVEEWPEQMILVEIDERCDALLQLPIATPIARVLTYLESFLPKIEDWERYASSQTSLRSLQSNIVALIVEWRRLELSSWARLLDKEEQQYGDRMADWWFRFYETIIRAPITLEEDSFTSQTLSTYLDSVVQVLETFFVSSPVGHFSKRLDLVHSFAELAAELSKEGFTVLTSVSALLSNIYRFYEHKGSEIVSHLAGERKRLEKDLQDIIRLASWRDVNVDALKASAQKSHRQLYKTIRKYRALLDKPAQDFLISPNASLATSAHTRDEAISDSLHLWNADLAGKAFETTLVLSDDSPAAVMHLDVTLPRLQGIVSSQYGRPDCVGAQALDDLRAIIVQRSTALRDEPSKGESKEEKAKAVSALSNRKRKAWSELLKETKRIGLSARPSERVLKMQIDSLSLYGAHPICDVVNETIVTRDSLKRADTLFYGILARLPAIRGLPANHHDDISSSQFASAAGSLQSLFGYILEDRYRLATALAKESHLQHRIDVLSEDMTIGLAQQQSHQAVIVIQTHLTRLAYLSDALEEIVQAATRHADLSMELSDKAAVEKLTESMIILQQQIQSSLLHLRAAYSGIASTGLLSQLHEVNLHQAQSCWDTSGQRLRSFSDEVPRLAYLTNPVCEWMSSQATGTEPKAYAEAEAAVTEYVKLISSVLNVVQSVSHREPVEILAEDGDIADLGVSKLGRDLQSTVAALHLSEVEEQLRKVCTACIGAPRDQRDALLSR